MRYWRREWTTGTLEHWKKLNNGSYYVVHVRIQLQCVISPVEPSIFCSAAELAIVWLYRKPCVTRNHNGGGSMVKSASSSNRDALGSMLTTRELSEEFST
ncbi:hypothetical protein EVAR_33125_1 [Eumeta japonica]|uniref:Uncharacterized protein n=1 Tax=Eumeta variegata TaxID=151549 RepID=A0A4C1YA09_EUMVA|nr:hypothetical protein EVAR_33125_1 [Eumeta japonica]